MWRLAFQAHGGQTAAASINWSEADWQWDPVALTATAKGKSVATGGSCAAAAVHPGSCSAAGSLQTRFLAQLGDSANVEVAGGAALSMPAAGTPGHSSSAALGTAVGTGSSSSDAAAAAKPPAAQPRGRGGSRGKKAGVAGGPSMCMAEGCGADLSGHTYYHQRNKICAVHIKAESFLRGGQQLRFCQRCGHPHELAEFDTGKHSCRKQLEKHNARRRKRQQDQGGPQPGANASEPLSALAPSADAQRPAAAKRSRARRGGTPPTAEAAGGLAAALPAEVLGAFAAAADGSCKPREGSSSAAASPPSACCNTQGGDAAALAGAAAVPAPGLPTAAPPCGSPGCSPSPDASASASAVATSLPPSAAAAAARPLLRLPSPPLPLLDFDLPLELHPTPFEDVFAPRPLLPDDAELADDLAAWLTANLAADEAADVARQGDATEASAAASLQPGPAQSAGWQLDAAGWQGAAGTAPPASLQLAQSIMWREALPLPFSEPSQQAQAQQRPGLHPQSLQYQQYHLQQQQHQAGSQPQQYAAPQPSGGPTVAATAPALPPSVPGPTLATVSVKLFGCTPAELPAGLRDHLKGWFEGAVQSLDGYLRPGCVHLTVQALLGSFAAQQLGMPGQPAAGAAGSGSGAPATTAPAAAGAEPAACSGGDRAAAKPPCCGRKRAAGPAAPSGGGDSAVRRVVECMLRSGEALWRSKTMLVQAGCHVALVHRGRLRQTWDVASASSRAVPAILRASPPLLLAGDPGELTVQGINMLQNDARLLLRLQGRYVQPAAAACQACSCSAPVHPGSGASVTGQVAAAADAARFEQRCCGCCVGKLQLAGLLPAGARPDAPTRLPACCQEAAAAPAAQSPQGQAEPQQAGCCRGGGQEERGTGSEPPSCCPGEGCPKAAPPAGPRRRVVAGAPSLQGVRLRLPGAAQQREQQEPLLPGLLHLDVQRRAFTAPQGARVLVVSSPAVHTELSQLAQQGGGELPQRLVDELGVVHEWLGRPEKMQYQIVEAVAARLLFWAVGSGLPATAGLLLSVLQAQGGSSAAAAARVLQSALAPPAASGSLDSLSQLHLAAQATAAAAMQRAGELACRDGLSLLHRAVQSGCATTLRAVLSWGEETGGGWRCDLAGPAGITPLHLAALLPEAAAARSTALLLLARCAPGAGAWTAACTADGQSPAAFFAAAAAARGGEGASGAAAALEAEAARLLHKQQQQQQQRLVGKVPAEATMPAMPRLKMQQAQPGSGAGACCAAQATASGAQAKPAAPAGGAGATLAAPEMQPGTPRKNPGCLCAPGCPCAQLDRCACCSSDSDEEGGDEGGGRHTGTCGGGSGKCCCCSPDDGSHLAGCAGCASVAPCGGGAPGGGPSGGCCGGGRQAPTPACGGGGM